MKLAEFITDGGQAAGQAAQAAQGAAQAGQTATGAQGGIQEWHGTLRAVREMLDEAQGIVAHPLAQQFLGGPAQAQGQGQPQGVRDFDGMMAEAEQGGAPPAQAQPQAQQGEEAPLHPPGYGETTDDDQDDDTDQDEAMLQKTKIAQAFIANADPEDVQHHVDQLVAWIEDQEPEHLQQLALQLVENLTEDQLDRLLAVADHLGGDLDA